MDEKKNTTNEDIDLMIHQLDKMRKESAEKEEIKIHQPTKNDDDSNDPPLWAQIVAAFILIALVIAMILMIPSAINTEEYWKAEMNAEYISALQQRESDNAKAEEEWNRLQQKSNSHSEWQVKEIEPMVQTFILDSEVNTEVKTIEYSLPSEYYDGIDFWSFQPYMDYRAVTNTSAPAYGICHNPDAWTDVSGFRRINDDYIIALGTFYNEHRTVGSRWLIKTTSGNFTAIVGDEKQDAHTDAMHMYGVHSNDIAGMIEYVVDIDQIPSICKKTGTMTSAGIEYIGAEIIGIERIMEE